MKLPKVSASIDRLGVKRSADIAGVLPSDWGGFITCMGFPNPLEAGACLGALAACVPTVAAAGAGYGICVGAACGAAGAAHAYRCAQTNGLI
jgi:hypothetical protein